MSSMIKRYPGDPFSQAVAYLFEHTSDKGALLKKLAKEMTPLVTKVAIKVGAISSEEEIAGSVKVFTGTISLYLSATTNGVNDVVKWAARLSESTLESLFREGFTMVHRLTECNTFVLQFDIEGNARQMADYLFRPPRRGKVKDELLISNLRSYSTKVDPKTCDWIGYGEYSADVDKVRQKETAINFALWLAQQPTIKLEIEALSRGDMGDPFETEILETDHLIDRVLINGSFRGSLSTRLNHQKLTAYTTEAAGLGKAWFEKRDGNYQRFLLMLPEQFQRALRTGELLKFYQELFTDKVNQAIRRKNEKKLLDILFYKLNGNSLVFARSGQAQLDKWAKEEKEERRADKKELDKIKRKGERRKQKKKVKKV